MPNKPTYTDNSRKPAMCIAPGELKPKAAERQAPGGLVREPGVATNAAPPVHDPPKSAALASGTSIPLISCPTIWRPWPVCRSV